MAELLRTFIFSVGLLLGLFLAGLVVFNFVYKSIRNRGRMMRGLNMELFLILVPQDEYLEPEQKPKTLLEKIQPMEQLYSVFSSLQEKDFWRNFEFGQPYLVWEIAY